MKPQEMQQPNMNPDESAAALSFATNLSEQMMPKMAPEQPQDAPQTPETAPGSETMPTEKETPTEEKSKQEEPEMEDHMKEMEKSFNEFTGKIEGIIETKFNDLTKMLSDKDK